MMVGLRSREEKVDLTILMLEDDLCAIFVRVHSEDWVIWFMLHHHIFIFDVVEFKLGGVVKHDQEGLIHEVLGYLFLRFKGKYLRLLIPFGRLDLVEVKFVLVREDCYMGVIQIDSFDCKLEIYFIDFFNILQNHSIPGPSEKFDIVSQTSRNMAWT